MKNKIKPDYVGMGMAREIIPLDEKIELMNVERGDRYHPMIDVEDVKEFIKRVKSRCSTFESAGVIITVLNEEAGDKLI